MSRRARIALVVLWVASLVGAGVFASEQSHSMRPLPGGETVVVAGEDVGFRIEGTIGGAPAGTLVIRRNGEWVEPRWKPGMRLVR